MLYLICILGLLNKLIVISALAPDGGSPVTRTFPVASIVNQETLELKPYKLFVASLIPFIRIWNCAPTKRVFENESASNTNPFTFIPIDGLIKKVNSLLSSTAEGEVLGRQSSWIR